MSDNIELAGTEQRIVFRLRALDSDGEAVVFEPDSPRSNPASRPQPAPRRNNASNGSEPSHLVAEVRPALDFERHAQAHSKKETATVFAHAYAKLPVQDVDRARTFYRDVLGLEPFNEQHGHLHYDVAGVPLLLFPSSGISSGNHDQFGLVVDDLPATIRQLNQRGVALESFDIAPGAVIEDGVMTREGLQAAWFKDSEGNLLSVAQFADGTPFRNRT